MRRFARAGGGGVATMFAFLVPVLLLFIGGVLDLSSMVNAKTHLQDATDAAALAVSAATAKNPNSTEPTLKVLAQSILTSDFNGATISDFHVCAPVQNDCTYNGSAMAMGTVAMTTTTSAPCYLGRFLPGVCTGGSTSRPLNVATTSTIAFGKTVEVNLILDTSGSMIVGASTADNNAIIAWNNVNANWATVHNPNEPNQSRPCAFACHDEGNGPGQTSAADMKAGLTNAAAAGAHTRFDVMQSAALSLLNSLNNDAANPLYNSPSFLYNIAQFNDGATILNAPYYDTNYANAKSAVTNNLTVGIDTDINGTLAYAAQLLGPNGNGTSTSSPLRLIILVTDGLQSNFSYDFPATTSNPANPSSYCNTYGTDSAWASDPLTNGYTAVGCYAQPITQTACNQIKQNGIVLAIVETPYVPLDGQDPGEKLYEVWVRDIIYPGGSGTPSAVEAALKSCASQGFFAIAASDSQIGDAMINMANSFLVPRLQR